MCKASVTLMWANVIQAKQCKQMRKHVGLWSMMSRALNIYIWVLD